MAFLVQFSFFGHINARNGDAALQITADNFAGYYHTKGPIMLLLFYSPSKGFFKKIKIERR